MNFNNKNNWAQGPPKLAYATVGTPFEAHKCYCCIPGDQ